MSDQGSLWGGRFQQQQDGFFETFNASLSFDKRLVWADIEGSRAYAKALEKVRTLSEAETKEILSGLDQLEANLKSSPQILEDAIKAGVEDIHSFVELELSKLIGHAAKKLHTGRSRNDQVATDLRLFARKEIDSLIAWVKGLQQSLLTRAEESVDSFLPGYTHLQRAQPIRWSHYFLSFFEMFSRDVERLYDCRRRLNRLPLGSGALAGNSQGVDRYYLAELLCFDDICLNSLDATSDRDFVVEIMSSASLIMMHLTRLAEDMILYCSQEFRFVSMSDKVATGSSLMPQKKNPDALELIRGKSGRVYGHLMAMLTVMKSLPSCYNKDMQEDKESLFDTIDTLRACLQVMKLVIDSLEINAEVSQKACVDGFLNATELADYLSKKGVAFRNAHHLVGEIVVYASKNNLSLEELSLEEYKNFFDGFDEKVYEALKIESTLDSKSSIGGTAKKCVEKALENAKKRLHWKPSLSSDF